LGKSLSVVEKLHARGHLHPVVKNGIAHFALSEVEALARPGRRPSPWLASPPRRRPTKAAVAPRRTEGEEAAHVFRLLDDGMSLREIVMRARVPPHRVRTLHREWTRSLDQGSPPDPRALGDGADLSALAAAAENIFRRS
jgi:hypothetical protein